MSIENVRVYFDQWQMADRILEFDVSSATVELAAKALNCEPARIAKTLSFQTKEGDGCILIVMAGDAKIDNAKFKKEFGMKAKMLSPDDALRLTGHAVGGVCPFAVHDDVAVFTDVSMQRFTTVFPACGSSNSAIELTCGDLYRYANSQKWLEVCKGWQEEKTE